MDIKLIKPNPNNPRVIRDAKFKQLVRSIQEFPEMLELRPIVVNEDMITLGGNMRLRACVEAGLTDVPVVIAKGLTEEQQQEFIIKDNVGFGEWDWDDLANNWDEANLKLWGLDFPLFDEGKVEDEQDTQLFVKVSIEATNDTFIEMNEKLQNLCDEYNVIMKVK
jgi:ParB-like chromosome segregation protein Spo0J